MTTLAHHFHTMENPIVTPSRSTAFRLRADGEEKEKVPLHSHNGVVLDPISEKDKLHPVDEIEYRLKYLCMTIFGANEGQLAEFTAESITRENMSIVNSESTKAWFINIRFQ